MLKGIFSNNILETISSNFKSIFNKDSSNKNEALNELEIIENEIENIELNIQKSDSVDTKHQLRKKTLYLKLKKCSLLTSNRYIKRASDIINEQIDDTLYEALSYLDRVPKNFDTNVLNEIYLYKAIIYEILEEFDEATALYKKALSINTTPIILRRYKEFIQRTKELLSWHKIKSKDIGYSSFNIHNITKLEDMPKVAKGLDKIAKYYARSPKSRSLGKRYHKEVMKIYKTLAKEYPKEYTCAYINSLLEAVELFMFSPTLLKEAQELLYGNYDCIKSRVALTSKLKELKQKTFIKKAILS